MPSTGDIVLDVPKTGCVMILPDWTGPASRIWSLVSGVPSSKRERRLMAMLQFYIDDSGMGQAPVYVLAGYMTTAEQWAAFSDEWANARDSEPRIEYFKIAEALRYRGEFSQFKSQQQRDEKVQRFVGILNKHAMHGFGLYMPDDTLRPDGVKHPLIEDWFPPYFVMFYGLMIQILRNPYFEKAGMSIEFIFDNQPGKMGFVMDAWEYFHEMASPELRGLLSPPTFRDDKKVLPLQAADMFAWYLRRGLVDQMTCKEPRTTDTGITVPHVIFPFNIDPKLLQKLGVHRASTLAKRRQLFDDTNRLAAGHALPTGPGTRALRAGDFFKK